MANPRHPWVILKADCEGGCLLACEPSKACPPAADFRFARDGEQLITYLRRDGQMLLQPFLHR